MFVPLLPVFQIHIDIPRTNPLIPLFQQPLVQEVSVRLAMPRPLFLPPPPFSLFLLFFSSTVSLLSFYALPLSLICPLCSMSSLPRFPPPPPLLACPFCPLLPSATHSPPLHLESHLSPFHSFCPVLPPPSAFSSFSSPPLISSIFLNLLPVFLLTFILW